MLDRDRLARWLVSPHRTWRWTDGSGEGYGAVETTDEGLRWYRWSHLFGEGGDGPHAERVQPWAAYHASGPAHAVPEAVARELAAWVAAHRPGAA